MLTRSFTILFLLFSGSLYLSACSCGNPHTPLEDVVCRADTTGGLVLELEMTRRFDDSNQARFRVAEVHIGNTDLRNIKLSGITSCAWYLGDDDQRGSRYLYFTHPDWLENGEGNLFNCGLNSNIYRMNNRGTKVDYPVGVNGRNVRMAYRDVASALFGCSSRGILVDQLRNLYLTNNPGPGLLEILNSETEFPRISSIDVYNIAGQKMQHIKPVILDQPSPVDLQDVPTGVYLIVVRQGAFLKTLRYVKR